MLRPLQHAPLAYALKLSRRVVNGLIAPRKLKTINSVHGPERPTWSHPASSAFRSARAVMPSLRNACRRCVSTVAWVMNRCCAICRLGSPSAARPATCRSALVSASGPVTALRRGRRPATVRAHGLDGPPAARVLGFVGSRARRAAAAGNWPRHGWRRDRLRGRLRGVHRRRGHADARRPGAGDAAAGRRRRRHLRRGRPRQRHAHRRPDGDRGPSAAEVADALAGRSPTAVFSDVPAGLFRMAEFFNTPAEPRPA